MLSFKYRAYPTREQIAALELHLREACRLYNAALQERRDAWKIARKHVGFYDQDKQLKDIRADGDIGIAAFGVSRDVLRRVDGAFAGFFRRVQSGHAPGFPRFRSAKRYDSVTFPKYGVSCRLLAKHVYLQGIGDVKVKVHRPLVGQPKTLTVKREAGRWYVVIASSVDASPMPASAHSIGIDVGLTTFATLSDCTSIENPRYDRVADSAVRVAQRRVARRKRGSHGRRKAVRMLQRARIRVRNQRADFHHKASRQIVNRYGLIAVEDLNIKGLARTRMAKSIHDVGWASFLEKLAYKAENAGRQFVRVNPANTTKACSQCGEVTDHPLSQRQHDCACGLSLGRDENAARNILRLGSSLAASTWPTRASVAAEGVAR